LKNQTSCEGWVFGNESDRDAVVGKNSSFEVNVKSDSEEGPFSTPARQQL
jgi:hypothetical protein